MRGRKSPYAVQDNSGESPESEEVSNDTVPPGTGSKDDRSPASATLLQQLHLFLHRAVKAPAYSHGSKRLKAKRSVGKGRGWQSVAQGVGYQSISEPRLLSEGPAVTPDTKLPRSLIQTERDYFLVVEPYRFQPSYTMIVKARHWCW